MKTISYVVKPCGYRVVVYCDSEIVFDYYAGNYARDSQQSCDLNSKWAVPIETLHRYARQTVIETATEYGVAKKNVQYDSALAI